MVTAGQEGDPRYIATQAPSGWGWSEANFWRMVLQQRAEVVVDLQAVHGMYATQVRAAPGRPACCCCALADAVLWQSVWTIAVAVLARS